MLQQPLRLHYTNAGLRLKPLPVSSIKIPKFNNEGYADPNRWTRENFTRGRKLSSIQSQRSRVFARQENRFPAVHNENPNALNRVYSNGVGRHSEPLQKVPNTRGQQTNLFSAPHAAGQSTANLPKLQSSLRNTGRSPNRTPNRSNQKFNVSKGQSNYQRSEGSPTSRMLATQIAGISSKEQGSHSFQKGSKMATGWAEVRAGKTIPNLREVPETDKSPRDHSPGGRATVDHQSDASSTSSPKKLVTQSDTKSSKENLARKLPTDRDSVDSGSKPAPKKSHISKKVAQPSKIKSKVSSGYGSMSSGSQTGEQQAVARYSIFKPSTQNDYEILDDDKVKEIAGVYKSKVKVEDSVQLVGTINPEQQHILTENEAKMYIHLKSAYKKMAEVEREKRKEQFFRKLQDVQIDAALQHNKELHLKQMKKEQAKKKQQEQLAHIRQKFEKERLKRYKSQYITKNFLNYERMDRREYGLPEHHMNKTEYQAKLKRTGGTKVTALDFIKREVKLKKNYVKMFAEPASVPSAHKREPKMEGRDQVTVEMFDSEGKPMKSKKVNVKSEIKEAQAMIKDIETNEDAVVVPQRSSDQSVPHKNTEARNGKQKPVGTNDKSQKSTSSQAKPTPSKPTITKPASKPNAVSTSKPKAASMSSQNSSKDMASDAGSKSNNKQVTKTVTGTQSENSAVYKPSAKESIAMLEQSNKPTVTNAPVYSSTGLTVESKKPADTVSLSSRISVITEESETGVDFYEQIMAKYGIELSDDDDDE